ncbi:hypothetical protein BD769DRAFT_1631371 [Suillus cothurnatus]|nr:hypothetical protein BD769DRAFT_1631371 [Suillus cothurnatus]
MTAEDANSSISRRHGFSTTDPLVSHIQHFGQTVFVLCNYPSLLTNGILRLEQMEDTPLENFPAEEQQEHHVSKQLLDSYPGLFGMIKEWGAAGARGDDTKMLKSAVLGWITPKGETIQPPLHRNSKVNHRFNPELTGFLLCPVGLDWNNLQTKTNLQSDKLWICGNQWLIFLYAHYTYDPEDPWGGLLRSHLLVYMGAIFFKAYKHVFTSPSSVEKELKARQSRNAHIHGMTFVTITSIAYITTQVFPPQHFTSLLDLLEDSEESKEVHELLTWWNW